jgi:hypothetical protein
MHLKNSKNKMLMIIQSFFLDTTTWRGTCASLSTINWTKLTCLQISSIWNHGLSQSKYSQVHFLRVVSK